MTLDNPKDIFAAATSAVKDNAETGKADPVALAEWVNPIPPNAPARPQKHYKYGDFSSEWFYQNVDGTASFYVRRFETEKGKSFAPLTLWREAGKLRWKCKAPPSPRPLFGSADLTARPNASVLIVEGEKAASTAAKYFPDWVTISCMGGVNGFKNSDWSPLRGRKCVIWPDNDAPGKAYASRLLDYLANQGAFVCCVDIPDGWPEKWDLADPLPENVAAVELVALAQTVLSQVRKPETTLWPDRFQMTEKGLFYQQAKDEPPQWLCAPIEVLGEVRTTQGGNWSFLLKWIDCDNKPHEHIFPKIDFLKEGDLAFAVFVNGGLSVSPDRNTGKRIAEAFRGVSTSIRKTLVDKAGWQYSNDGIAIEYLWPSKSVAGGLAAKSDLTMPGLNTGQIDSRFDRCGSLEGWKHEIASLAENEPRALFALSCAFAGPLLRPLLGEGGGFHFFGNSSTGKTTLLNLAGSVWGGGASGFTRSWRTTDNALEGLAILHNDGLLSLDEIGQCSAKALEQAAYQIANGQGKSRLNSDAILKTSSTWRVMLLSSGELTLQEALAREGIQAKTGQELRLVNLPADAEQGKGVWIHAANPAQFSEHLNKVCQSHYGWAGPEFVRHLIANYSAMQDQAYHLIAQFEASVLRGDCPGQISRTAKRFAIVAAAGQLANEALQLGWSDTAIQGAAANLFETWKQDASIHKSGEAMQCLTAIMDELSSWPGKFPVKEGFVNSPMEVYGFIEGEDLLLSSSGMNAITKLKATRAAKSLDTLGLLKRSDEQNRLQKRVRIGRSNSRYYVFDLNLADQILCPVKSSGNTGNSGNTQ